jgi:hypothetical protein
MNFCCWTLTARFKLRCQRLKNPTWVASRLRELYPKIIFSIHSNIHPDHVGSNASSVE